MQINANREKYDCGLQGPSQRAFRVFPLLSPLFFGHVDQRIEQPPLPPLPGTMTPEAFLSFFLPLFTFPSQIRVGTHTHTLLIELTNEGEIERESSALFLALCLKGRPKVPFVQSVLFRAEQSKLRVRKTETAS